MFMENEDMRRRCVLKSRTMNTIYHRALPFKAHICLNKHTLVRHKLTRSVVENEKGVEERHVYILKHSVCITKSILLHM